MLVAIDMSRNISPEDFETFAEEVRVIQEMEALEAMADEHSYYNQFGE